MNTEELKRLAEIVEPGAKWRINGDSVFYEGPGAYDFDNIYFRPSITGENWQQAQACRVIVAAAVISHGRFVINGPAVFDENGEGDILATAIAALLQEGR